ncbi:MAG TPA: HAMP domain-containing sensor histidine kinase [Marmoricola sp.]|nr:HAMP domain-containing sensor histidine kinase [Marmoricola sp.]
MSSPPEVTRPPLLLRLRAGVRIRSAAFATLVVAAVMAAGSAGLLLLLQGGVRADVRAAAEARLGEVVGRLHQGTGAALRHDVELRTHEGQLVQVLGTGGRILAASSARAAQRPLTALRPPAGVTSSSRATLRALGGNRPYLVLARGVQHGGSTDTVVVASSLETVSDSVERLLSYLLAALPLTLLLVAGGTWLLVGRALGPVEQIRRQVASLEATDLSRRVPVPVTYDEVQRLAETMNQMLARLEQAQQLQRRFVSDASHELRSPLATLSASLELTASRDDDDLHRIMQAEVVRMRRLVDDLLLLTRADDHGLRPVLEDVDLDDVARRAVARLRAATDLQVVAAIAPVRVQGDPGRLEQMLGNLLDNAAHAAASTVQVSLTATGGTALLVVEDDGPGIPPQDRARAFERFVRLDPGRSRDDGGSGLGLSIVREIARGHHITIVLGDAPLGGARFELRMACEPDDEPDGEPDEELDEELDEQPGEAQAPERAGTPPAGSSR